jgi:hypothetical protein
MVILYIYSTCWCMKSVFYECQQSDLPQLVCFLVFRWLTRKHLVILADVVSECITFSEAPRLARKCGTHRSDSPVRAL